MRPQASINAALLQLGTLPPMTRTITIFRNVGEDVYALHDAAEFTLSLLWRRPGDPSVTTTGNTVLATGIAGGTIIDNNTGVLGDYLIADGSSWLQVTQGDNTLQAGAASSTLVGGSGHDTLYGGSGQQFTGRRGAFLSLGANGQQHIGRRPGCRGERLSLWRFGRRPPEGGPRR